MNILPVSRDSDTQAFEIPQGNCFIENWSIESAHFWRSGFACMVLATDL